ncbi:MAG: hypothetical protein M3265_01480 [Actinomycetota bacterium]|nr:hypothetical protein [Actinomycetota bacterium]
MDTFLTVASKRDWRNLAARAILGGCPSHAVSSRTALSGGMDADPNRKRRYELVERR